MSHFNPHLLSPSDRFNYTMITPQYSPDTTIAIKLRQFEKESKSQAEREYDAEHGPMPEPPADDDNSMGISDRERTSMKKKRKVRSALVSRKKTAIYEKKLEDELQLSDRNNAYLQTRLSLYKDGLRDIRTKIDIMERTLDARKDVPKRMRTAVPPIVNPVHRIPHQNNMVFPDDNQIADILSFPQEEPQLMNKAHPAINDLSSECSDRQISPMLQPQRPEQRDVPTGFPVEDFPWKTYFPQNTQPPVVQMLGASFAM